MNPIFWHNPLEIINSLQTELIAEGVNLLLGNQIDIIKPDKKSITLKNGLKIFLKWYDSYYS